MDKWERRWRDPDYDWVTGDYYDDDPAPEEKKNVYQFVRENMEEAKRFFFVKDPRKELTPEEFREWLFQMIEEENGGYTWLPYDEDYIKEAIEEIWEEI